MRDRQCPTKPTIGTWRGGSRGPHRERDCKAICRRGCDSDVNAIRHEWHVRQQPREVHETQQNAPCENSTPRWRGP